MENRIAQFEKVSFGQFLKDIKNSTTGYTEEEIQEIYDNIKLPQRATMGSAGYDFFTWDGFTFPHGKTVKLPTGIKVKIDEGWALKLYPRSSLGFKYKMQLNNTVGIIDSDYYYSDNEGHIWVKLTNNGDKAFYFDKGDAFIQGVFVPYGITVDDEVTELRNGGFGSTNR